jgi:uncharacterized protein (TIGR02271 family)
MTDTQMTDVAAWVDRTLVSASGEKIGTIGAIYSDQDTEQPEWLAVSTGWFGTRMSFVPLRGATRRGDDVMVHFDKAQVKDAPNADPDGQLSQEEEARLYEHYGLSYSESRSNTGLPDDQGSAGGPTGRDVSGPTTDDAMTRSEEELRLGTAKQESGRVRLKKYVVTENVTTTVPVQHEEVRVEREPITDQNIDRATSGPDISEEEHEITLNEEQVVVEKRVVPKERVRLEKDTVTEDKEISEQVRKERIDVEGDGTQRP